MSAPLSAIIEGDLTEVVIEEERIVLELWAGFPQGGGGGDGDATSIQGIPVSGTDPLSGEALVYTGASYEPVNIATQAELDAGLALKADVVHTHTFASLTSKPTTLAGYGITDAALDADLDTHTARVDNPHSVTAAQVGAFTTAQGAALQAELDAHEALTNNPHAVTKTQVGLGNVENTALSTWAGSANITTVGTIGTGVWNATAIAWAKVDKTGSSLADLTTRSAGDLSSGNLAHARLPTGVGTWALGGNLTMSGGTVLNTTGLEIGPATGTPLLMTGQDGTVSFRMDVADSTATSTIRPRIFLRRARGTLASPSSVAATDVIGELHGQAVGAGTTYTDAAKIAFVSSGDWSVAGTRSADIVFSTRSLNTFADRWKILASGILESVGAQTIQASTGSLTLSAPSGNVVVSGPGILFVGDTSNANMTQGLTINQGAADNEALALKSSDVTHPFTSLAEADTYCVLRKVEATSGGLTIQGFKSAAGVAGNALNFTGVLGEAADTTKTTAGIGVMTLGAFITDGGTSVAAVGADGNLLAIRNATTTRFIFDAEGDAHADVSWTTFDQHHDLAVLEDLEAHLAPGQVRRRFGQVVAHDRAFFEREGLLHDVREVAPGRVRGMLNTTRLLMLHSGAIREVGGRQQQLEAALRDLVAMNPGLHGADRALALLDA